MDVLQQIVQPIEQEMAHYEQIYGSFLTHRHALLNEILQQVARRKGKMMRPMLVLLSAKLFGEIGENTIFSAAAFEYFHNASLLHDDVVDSSDERRGLPSVNAAFGNKAAVLVGDYLLALSLKTAAMTNNPQVISVVSDAAQGLSDGELLQLRSVCNREISEAVYYDIIRAKTAALFSACTQAGALTAAAADDDVQRLKMFGELVGICFQIKDDIFDYMSDAQIGKPTGNDMREGKLTLPVIHALTASGDEAMMAVARRVKDGTADVRQIDELVDFTLRQGGIDYAAAAMERHAQQAKELLSVYADSSVKSALFAYVDYVVGRNF